MTEKTVGGSPAVRKRRTSLALKLNILIVALILIVAAVLIIISYNVYTQTVYEPVVDSLQSWIKSCAGSFEISATDVSGEVVNRPGMLKLLLEAAQSEELQSIRNSTSDPQEQKDQIIAWMTALSTVEDESNVLNDYTVYGSFLLSWYNLYDQRRTQSDNHEHDLYEVWVEGEANGRRYVLTLDNEEIPGVPVDPFGDTFDLPDIFSGYAFTEPIAPTQVRIRDRESLMAAAPIRDEDNQVIARVWALMDVDRILTARGDFLLISILLTLGLAIFACCITMLLLRRIALRPIQELSGAASRFISEEKEYTHADVVQLNIKSRDEIGQLYREIQSMQTRIIDYTEEKTRTAAEQQRAKTEMELAARIQNSMLPHKFPPFPDRHEFDIYASMDPAKEVGGDFYDFFFIDPDHLCLLIADVSGKGVPASLYMMISEVTLQSCALLGLPVDQILQKANDALSANNPEKMFVTVWLGILEVSTGKLTAVNAGHEYPALMRAGKPFEILKDKHGICVGAMESYPFKSYELQLEPGDKLFVYTDGVPEANNHSNAMFGVQNMLRSLNRLTGETPEGVLKGVREDVDAFVNGADQFDDLTMLCLEYKGPQGEKPDAPATA